VEKARNRELQKLDAASTARTISQLTEIPTPSASLDVACSATAALSPLHVTFWRDFN